jgi:hypothetical protein
MRQAASSPLNKQTVLAARKPLFKVDSREAKKRARRSNAWKRAFTNRSRRSRNYTWRERASEKRAFNQARELGQRTVEVQAMLDNLMSEWEKLAVENRKNTGDRPVFFSTVAQLRSFGYNYFMTLL